MSDKKSKYFFLREIMGKSTIGDLPHQRIHQQYDFKICGKVRCVCKEFHPQAQKTLSLLAYINFELPSREHTTLGKP